MVSSARLRAPCRRGISCIRARVGVTLTALAFGSCLKGLDVVERAAEGPVLRDRRRALDRKRKKREKENNQNNLSLQILGCCMFETSASPALLVYLPGRQPMRNQAT